MDALMVGPPLTAVETFTAAVDLSQGEYVARRADGRVGRPTFKEAMSGQIIGLAAHSVAKGQPVLVTPTAMPENIVTKKQAAQAGSALPWKWIASGEVLAPHLFEAQAETRYTPPVIETYELGGCFIVASVSPREAWLGRRLRDGETAPPLDGHHPFAAYIRSSPKLGGLTWQAVPAADLAACDSMKAVYECLTLHAQAWAGPPSAAGRRIIVEA